MAVLVIVAGLGLSIMTATTSAWNVNKARMGAFAEARVAFETLTHRLSQATLNTYWDYDNRGTPTRYLRKSELHFIQGRAADLLPAVPNTSTDAVFFVAPLGITDTTNYQPLVKMLSACGFYVRFDADSNRPAFLDGKIAKRYRFRLYQFLQPGERLGIYPPPQGNNWFQNDILNWSFPMADNVIGLILRVKYPVAGGSTVVSTYDSRLNPNPNLPPATFNQLPPVISATLVVIDESSARRLENGANPPAILPDPPAFLLPGQYDQDISDWETKLQNFVPKIAYRVLSADIHLRSEWPGFPLSR